MTNVYIVVLVSLAFCRWTRSREVKMCVVPEIPFSMFIKVPVNYNRTYTTGESITLACKPGFEAKPGGNPIRICISGGWTRFPFECEGKHACKRTVRAPRTRCTQECSPVSGCSFPNHDCLCDGSCGYSCVEIGMTCGTPPQLENGNHWFTGANYNDTANYTCDDGYSLNTGPVKRCTAKKRWDGLSPRCLRDCPQPKIARNAYISNPRDKYRSSDKVTFKCNQGYNQEGMATQMCFLGKWTYLPFKCTEGGCGDPGTPEHGRKLGVMYSVNSRVYFNCDLGYELYGTKLRKCQLNGTWTGTQPICQVVDCGFPPRPLNGTFIGNETTFQSSLEFKCDDGFDLEGAENRMCTSDKNWSGKEVTCTQMTCGTPPPVKNGNRWFTGANYNDTANYNCDDGFSLNTAPVKRCTAKKRWSGLASRCLRDCPQPKIPRNANISNPRDRYRSSDKVTFKCNLGYNQEGMATQMCFLGKWTVLPFKCTEEGCGDPGTPKHGRKLGVTYLVNSRVYFNCDLGYELNGSELRMCQLNGTWTGTQPICKVVDCGFPPRPLNGTFIGSETTFQSSLEFKCDDGFDLEGAKNRMCTSDKTWSGKEVTCTRRDCPQPKIPRNAMILNPREKYRSRDKVVFVCNLGSNRQNVATQMCVLGKWTVLPFHCTG